MKQQKLITKKQQKQQKVELDELYNQYMKNKSALIKRYGAEAPKVMRGRAIKLAKGMV